MDEQTEWLTKEQVLAALNLDDKTFNQYIRDQVFPLGVKRGKRRYWRRIEIPVLVWLEENQHRWYQRTPVKGKE